MAKLAAVRSTSFSRLKCQRCRLCSIPRSAPLREKKNFTGLKSFSSFYVHFVILLLCFYLLLFFSSSSAALVQLELCLSLSALNQFRRRIWTHMSRELARLARGRRGGAWTRVCNLNELLPLMGLLGLLTETVLSLEVTLCKSEMEPA